MKAYKGFDKDLKCRNFQYEVGKAYEEKDAQICKTGFHACENPLEVFRYYPPCDGHRYCEVEQSGTLSKSGGSFRVTSTKIKINNEIGLEGLIQAVINKSGESESYSINTGNHTVVENVESYSIALNKSYGSVAANTGDYSLTTTIRGSSIAANTGSCSAAVNRGYHSIAANAGERSVAISGNDDSVAVNIGNRSTAINNGDQSVALNMGGHAEALVTKEGSIAIATGIQSKAKGALGSAIVLVERTTWNGRVYSLNNIKAAIVDGEKIKADTWYTLRNGEFVEV